MNAASANRWLLVGFLVGTAVVYSNRTTIRSTVQSAKLKAKGARMSAGITSTAPIVASDRTALINATEAAIYKEVPARRLSPQASRTLAVNLVVIANQEGYPLDLLLGHALAESSLTLSPKVNSAGAVGPLQVTRITCQQMGESYPPESPEVQLQVGVRYMKYLRAAFSECAGSAQVTLQHYGMGRGNWLKWRADGCKTSPCTNPVSVWRAECGCGRGYSALVMSVAVRHPELHTAAWW